jgi:hypothetical protein
VYIYIHCIYICVMCIYIHIYIRTHSIHLCVCVCVHAQRHVQSKVNYSWFLAIGSLFCRTLQSTNQSPLPPGWLIDFACVTTNNLPQSLELEFQPQSGMHTHKSGIPERIEFTESFVQNEISVSPWEPWNACNGTKRTKSATLWTVSLRTTILSMPEYAILRVRTSGRSCCHYAQQILGEGVCVWKAPQSQHVGIEIQHDLPLSFSAGDAGGSFCPLGKYFFRSWPLFSVISEHE